MAEIADITVAWEGYAPPQAMRRIMDAFNALNEPEIRAQLPVSQQHRGRRARLWYRVFAEDPIAEIEHAYVIIGGFAERPDALDTGMKGLLSSMLAHEVDERKTAVVLVSGLFSFTGRQRALHQWHGSSALLAASEEIAELTGTLFAPTTSVTVSGFSMGGVLAPLVARAIADRAVLEVERVHAAEPCYTVGTSSTVRLLRRFSRSSAYRNDQITASGLATYIAAKTTPGSPAAKMVYRARVYNPLLRHGLSMRHVVRDMARQAEQHGPNGTSLQFAMALRELADQGVAISVLSAERSVICRRESIDRLLDDLRQRGAAVTAVRVVGRQADHGIEEQRSLSTPFLVRPELYLYSS